MIVDSNNNNNNNNNTKFIQRHNAVRRLQRLFSGLLFWATLYSLIVDKRFYSEQQTVRSVTRSRTMRKNAATFLTEVLDSFMKKYFIELQLVVVGSESISFRQSILLYRWFCCVSKEQLNELGLLCIIYITTMSTTIQ